MVFTIAAQVVSGTTLEVKGFVNQFNSPVGFHKVYFTGSGFQTYTTTDNLGKYSILLQANNSNGVFAAFTINCLGDTLSAFKEYNSQSTSFEIVFNRCASVQRTTVKGIVTYQGRPMPNQKVKFCFNSPQAIADSAVTDSNGLYIKTIVSAAQSSGLLYAITTNCDDQEIQQSSFYNIEDTTELNFNYCNGGNFKILTGRVINNQLKMKKNDFHLRLYQQNKQNQQLEFLASTESDIEGTFMFLLNRDSKYLIKATPNKGTPARPSYYGGSPLWSQGSIISLGNDSVKIINIPVAPMALNYGNSSIAGFVLDTRENKEENHSVYLQNSIGRIIDVGNCEEDGSFIFNNIPEGTYTLYTDVVGLPTNPIDITINDSEQATDLKIIVNKKEVTHELILSKGEIETTTGFVELFPNPFQNEINYTVTDKHEKQIQIIDISGKIIFEATFPPFSSSIIHTTLWERGFYVVNVFENGLLIDTRKIIK